MKKFEDIIRDSLEGYGRELPEGDLAEFKSMLDNVEAFPAKRGARYLPWLVPAAAAAGLALFFILRHGPEQDVIHAIDRSELVADAIEPEMPVGITEDETPDVIAEDTKRPLSAYVPIPENIEKEENVIPVSSDIAEETVDGHAELESNNAADAAQDLGSSASTDGTGTSPFVPSVVSMKRKPVSVNVGRASAGVLGGSGVIALASILPSLLNNEVPPVIVPGMNLNNPDAIKDNNKHYMPLRAGLSIRIPCNERWSLTTGIEYSLYSSRIGYSISSGKQQNAHYIEIPLRADLTIARNKWMDVYVGAGASADFCIAAFGAGQKIAKGSIGFSLIGTGGIQFNITNHIGVFLDPTFSWNVPSENRILETYKTKYPFMFAISSGLRVTLN